MKKIIIASCFGLYLLVTACQAPAFASPVIGTEERAELLRKMDQQAPRFGDISRQIWEFAEVGYKEVRSSELLKSELRSAGFRIQDNIGGIPTAFTARSSQPQPTFQERPVTAGSPRHAPG